jgi:hypothetical protein
MVQKGLQYHIVRGMMLFQNRPFTELIGKESTNASCER